MIIAELPIEEELRLLDLASYDIMDTHAENDFDELVELASQICNCPISLITLLDKDRQWFKAKVGLDDDSTSRDVAFCSHAILQKNVMEIQDATKDIRFADNPLVTGELNIRFYAGAPIISPDGYNLGTICIIDHKPKKLSKEEERTLVLLSNQVTKLLELKKKNKLIRNRAEEMIGLKSAVISKAIETQEKDKHHIASNLHEELAQQIATSMLYLKLATESEGDRLIHINTAYDQLENLLHNIKKLSYSITPQTINWIPSEELVKEFVEKTAVTFPFEISYFIEGKKSQHKAEISLIAIRIIEEWLKMLSAKQEITLVKITVKPHTTFELHIEDNGTEGFEERKKEIFNSLVYDRTKINGGIIDLSKSANGNNLLKIMLPSAATADLAEKQNRA